MSNAATESTVTTTVVSVLGGAWLVAAIKATRDAYVARLRNREEMARTEAAREHEEREESLQFATLGVDERRRLDARIEAQNEKIIQLTEKVSRCEEQHRAAQRQYEEERAERQSLSDDVAAMKCHLDLQQQLIDKQREQIDKQREQIDKLVRTLMERGA